MTFSSLVFLFIFFPIVFTLYALIKNKTARNIILAAASIVFYAFGEPVAVIIMLVSIVFNYLLGLMASKTKHDKLACVIAVIINIGLLLFYKYLGFFTEILNNITRLTLPVLHLRLPIGISFFTFQGLSYVIDVYRNKENVQKNLFSVLLYISFFPQLIAGPIVRYEDIAKQINEREFNSTRISQGLKRFIFGLGKKVIISNPMGFVADTVFKFSAGELGMLASWIGAICYALQIFFDFSGYSDMAIGLGKIFGFDFKENFNYPYIAYSIQDFWRRWHISLSTWFKEYVYIPLGGNRKGKFRTVLNKLIVFFLTGLWHGANFTFILWGMIHGLFQLLETYQIIPTQKKWFKYVGHIYTLLVVVITFVLFRADTIGQGIGIIANMFNGAKGIASVNAEVLGCVNPFFIVAFMLGILACMPIYPKIREAISKKANYKIYNYATYVGSIAVFILCILLLVSSQYNPFIYFRF